MKEFAGVNLVNFKIDDYVARHKASKNFLANYKNKYCYPDGFPDPQLAILSIENCIKANLTLPINAEESVAIVLSSLPGDEYLKSQTKKTKLILQLKLALRQAGYNDADLATLGLLGKIKAVRAVRSAITQQYKDWHLSAEILCHAVCSQNLLIAADCICAIAALDKHEARNVTNQRMASLYGLQIRNGLEIMTYIEDRLKVLHGPFYTQYEPGYVEMIQYLYKSAEFVVNVALSALRALPESTPAAENHSRKRLLTFVHRDHPYAQVSPEENIKRLGLSLDI